jgi:Resolvase, N terminal domain
VTNSPYLPENVPSLSPPASQHARAVVFARTRSMPPDPARDDRALDQQEEACRRAAADLGAEVVQVYRAVGGAHDPDVQRAIAYMAVLAYAERVTYVVVADMDRLTRLGANLTPGLEIIVAGQARR